MLIDNTRYKTYKDFNPKFERFRTIYNEEIEATDYNNIDGVFNCYYHCKDFLNYILKHVLPTFPFWWSGFSKAAGHTRTVSNAIAESQFRYLKNVQLHHRKRDTPAMVIRKLKSTSMGAFKEAHVKLFGTIPETIPSEPTIEPIEEEATVLTQDYEGWNKRSSTPLTSSKAKSMAAEHSIRTPVSILARQPQHIISPHIPKPNNLRLFNETKKRLAKRKQLIAPTRETKYIPFNCELHYVKGDGNCLFRAFSHQLKGDEEKWRPFRQATYRRMKNNLHELKSFATGLIMEHFDLLPNVESHFDDNVIEDFLLNYGK